MAGTTVAKNRPRPTDETPAAFVTVPKAAKRLGISDRAAYSHVDHGRFPSIQIGGRLLIPAAFIEDIVQRAERGERVKI